MGLFSPILSCFPTNQHCASIKSLIFLLALCQYKYTSLSHSALHWLTCSSVARNTRHGLFYLHHHTNRLLTNAAFPLAWTKCVRNYNVQLFWKNSDCRSQNIWTNGHFGGRSLLLIIQILHQIFEGHKHVCENFTVVFSINMFATYTLLFILN